MAARSQSNDHWGSVGNGAKHSEEHSGCSVVVVVCDDNNVDLRCKIQEALN